MKILNKLHVYHCKDCEVLDSLASKLLLIVFGAGVLVGIIIVTLF